MKYPRKKNFHISFIIKTFFHIGLLFIHHPFFAAVVIMNEKIKNLKTEVLSDDWYTLRKVTYDYVRSDGTVQRQSREAYDRGNGATVLLYNKEQRTVILTRQLRIPTYINGNKNGLLIEACAGMLDHDNPEECILREAKEETGYQISKIQKLYEAYTSPGSVTELVYFFIAEYSPDMKVSDGGGIDQEQEHIEVLELDFDEAFRMIYTGEIRDVKTIMLLQHLKLNNIL